ncbi:hypothetical protein DXA58_20090 [Bacteroides uniformis]|nr:hypothetical protein DXA58_20090 [Bacteroides uniformis]
MAEISDILKIGKDKYLEKNLEQKMWKVLLIEWILMILSVLGVMSKMESKNMKSMVRTYIAV